MVTEKYKGCQHVLAFRYAIKKISSAVFLQSFYKPHRRMIIILVLFGES